MKKQAIVIKPQSKAKMAPVRQAILKDWRPYALSVFKRNGIMKMTRFAVPAEKRTETAGPIPKRRTVLNRDFDLI